MKFASYTLNKNPSFGIVTDQGIIDLPSRLRSKAVDLKSLLIEGLDSNELSEIEASADVFVGIDAVDFLPVIPNPGAIFCMGMNTHTHIEEIARVSGEHKTPQKPSLFMRTNRTQLGHRQPLEKPNGSPLFDYEGEIAMIIGRLGRHIPESEALDYVAGYSCYNDASVRDYQLHSHLFTSGKNFPRTGGFGPWLVTPDEAGAPEELTLSTRLNGDIVQQMNYDDLVYKFTEIISYVSEFTELHPGDVIVTGSPAGSALFSQPQQWLQVGDRIEVEVSGVGTLVNTVAAAEGINVAPVTRSNADEAFMQALAFAKNR